MHLCCLLIIIVNHLVNDIDYIRVSCIYIRLRVLLHKVHLIQSTVPYDLHICKIERFEIHRIPFVSVQTLANALAEATPTPIAHEDKEERA